MAQVQRPRPAQGLHGKPKRALPALCARVVPADGHRARRDGETVNMMHLGDITKISGHDVPIVDAVIGGSPCQDLSIAGKRAGLAGARSGLFMEQIRIIKEMREKDKRAGKPANLVRPRFILWENVPGAFSSNKGEDFREVLEETIRIAEPDAPDIPLPASGKWPMADAWFGNGWSIAYRVFDAQFWGVPQRRRRIALVADFGGWAAPEILFVRQSVCGDIEPGAAAGDTVAAGTGSGASEASGSGTEYLTGWDNQEKRVFSDRGVSPTLAGSDGGGRTVCGYIFTDAQRVAAVDCRNGTINQEINGTPLSHQNGGLSSTNLNNVVMTYPPDVANTLKEKANLSFRGDSDTIVMSTGQANAEITKDIAPTINCNHEQPVIAFTERGRKGGRSCETQENIMYALTNPGEGGRTSSRQICAGGTVRRLTPLECERLQGYPDGWTDIGPWTDSKGKLHKESSDSARYKALGNSIALPPWAWVLKRLCACYERQATMASLFDGIGGFPLIWERLNGPGSCLWASEIEEFPIAVTRRRFGAEGVEQ